MDHFYERNVSEIRNEYTTFLINLMNPFIYEGIRSVYQFALNAHAEFLERGKHDAEVKSPGILKIFQLSLKEIPTLNNNSIEIEANRIKAGSKCADWFDDLVKAVIKSNIVLLIFANPKKRSEILKEEHHNRIEVKDFIHKCYIESARMIYNNPELFWHEFPPLEIKRNQREACDLIKQAIHEAIRKVLPIKLILKEYLQNNYVDDDNDITNRISDTQYMNVHSLIKRDLYGENDSLGRQQIKSKSVLESESESEEDLEGGNSNSSSSSSSSSSENKDEDYLSNKSEDLANNENLNDSDSDNFFEEIKNKLETVKASVEDKPQPVVVQTQPEIATVQPNPPIILQSNQPIQPLQLTQPVLQPVQPQPVQQQPVLQQPIQSVQTGGNSKVEFDEIKELLKKSNVVTTLEKPRKKYNKKELLLLKEIEDRMKPKEEEPDRKLFFEQYMK